MFCVNLEYTWSIDGEVGLDGIVFSASGVNLVQFKQRGGHNYNPNIKIFDPKLYLSNFNSEDTSLPCSRLASYPWFPTNVQEYDPEHEENMTDWFNDVRNTIEEDWTSDLPEDPAAIEKLAKSCIDFQEEINTSHIILPAPLTRENDGLEYEMQWIDAGLKATDDIDKPIYATLALSDLLLRHDGSINNEIIQVAYDQLTTRNRIDGVYFVLERHAPNSRRVSNENVAEAILTLSHLFGINADLDFFVNYCGEFGFIALGAGASHFASNDTLKGKRLHMADYIPRGGGTNYPNFFSISCLSDFRSKTDLEKIRDEGLLRYLENDKTRFSENLLQALERGDSVDTVPDWAEELNNVSTANDHFIELLSLKAKEASSLPQDEKFKYIRNILLDAYRNMTFLNEIIEDELLYENGDHLKVWKRAFDSYQNNFR